MTSVIPMMSPSGDYIMELQVLLCGIISTKRRVFGLVGLQSPQIFNVNDSTQKSGDVIYL